MTDQPFQPRTPPHADFSSRAVTRRPPPPPEQTAPPNPPADQSPADHVPGDQPANGSTTTTLRRRPRRPASSSGAAPPQPPNEPTPTDSKPPTDATASQTRRGAFRAVTVWFSAEALAWFDRERETREMSQRDLLLDLLVAHGLDIEPTEDRVNANRAALGLPPTKPPARHGRMVSINVSVHHDEAAAIDDAAAKVGLSRSAFCEALVQRARARPGPG